MPGTISIDIAKPVSTDEAIRIIETALYLNGFALVPTEGNIVKAGGQRQKPAQFRDQYLLGPEPDPG